MIRAAAVLVFVAGSSWAGQAVDVVELSLKLWAPVRVEQIAGVLQVVSGIDRVDDGAYRAMLSAACGTVWDNAGAWGDDYVAAMAFLNRHGRQGWVFEGGQAECIRLGELAPKDATVWIFGRTRMY